MPKDLHRKASKGDKVCAVFTHHLRTGDKGYLHWGKVLAVEGSECTIKWQTDKKPSSHSIADVFLTEAAAWAAFHSIPSSDSASEAPLYPDSDHEATGPKTSLRSAAQVNTQPGTSQSREALYINKKRFEVPEGYTGNLGLLLFVVVNGGFGVCEALVEGKRGSVMFVIVHSAHNSTVLHIAIPCCFF